MNKDLDTAYKALVEDDLEALREVKMRTSLMLDADIIHALKIKAKENHYKHYQAYLRDLLRFNLFGEKCPDKVNIADKVNKLEEKINFLENFFTRDKAPSKAGKEKHSKKDQMSPEEKLINAIFGKDEKGRNAIKKYIEEDEQKHLKEG
jgi:plasmid stability protein